VEAYKWFNLAAAQGNTNAMARRALIMKKMSIDEINEAQRRSAEVLQKTQAQPSP
jgi:TPR repeat protein